VYHCQHVVGIASPNQAPTSHSPRLVKPLLRTKRASNSPGPESSAGWGHPRVAGTLVVSVVKRYALPPPRHRQSPNPPDRKHSWLPGGDHHAARARHDGPDSVGDVIGESVAVAAGYVKRRCGNAGKIDMSTTAFVD
jgi:hypothetical protein